MKDKGRNEKTNEGMKKQKNRHSGVASFLGAPQRAQTSPAHVLSPPRPSPAVPLPIPGRVV